MIALYPRIGPNVIGAVPEERIQRIEQIYNSTPQPSNVRFTSREFIWRMGGIIYKEWCLGEAKEQKAKHCDYHGQVFVQFIDDEILWEDKRECEIRRKAGLPTVSEEKWLRVEERVLGALVRRGIEFFSQFPRWEDDPPQGVHMRTDLSKYMR